jgi:hypothetical protein
LFRWLHDQIAGGARRLEPIPTSDRTAQGIGRFDSEIVGRFRCLYPIAPNVQPLLETYPKLT